MEILATLGRQGHRAAQAQQDHRARLVTLVYRVTLGIRDRQVHLAPPAHLDLPVTLEIQDRRVHLATQVPRVLWALSAHKVTLEILVLSATQGQQVLREILVH
jgi:hypothetical protein